ncbi:DUF4097 family beta strand repeat-containing protein [Spirillospora sp. NPDC047279]|uniref:DUF4097 family beta strand repeat-containing protein n=1 Tax=Spirillospora sp. NPDC047279 TaxID=3155478 RepID=UPI0033FAFEEC
MAADRADTVVEVLPADPSKGRDVKVAEQATVDYAGGVLRIQAKAGNQVLGASGSVVVTVQPPAGSSVQARAASAEVRAAGRFGDVAFEGAYGAVEIDEVAGLHLATAAGDVTVGRLNGPAEVSTAKGDIQITEAVRGEVVLTTQAGQITVGAAAGVSASLDAGTSYGRIHNSLTNTQGADTQLAITATTAYGDVTARSL